MDHNYQITAIIWILTLNLLMWGVGAEEFPSTCLTGKMTDVQSWVQENGQLTENVDRRFALDLSTTPSPTLGLVHYMYRNTQQRVVKYLSLARCNLNRIPAIFDLQMADGRNLSQSLMYLTLYGNKMLQTSLAGKHYVAELQAVGAIEAEVGFGTREQFGALWSASVLRVRFESLLELDLRACGIETLDPLVFSNMPQLEALYLSNNALVVISSDAFVGLGNLLHLDISNNKAIDSRGINRAMTVDSDQVFQPLTRLRSVDFSNTKLNVHMHRAFRGFGKSLERASLCNTGLFNLENNYFNSTSLKVLDISRNPGIMLRSNVLISLKDTLKVLYATEIGLTSFDVFENFTQLEILDVSSNELSNIRRPTMKTLKNLQVLNVRRNRLTAWSVDLFVNNKNLRFLDVGKNMIVVITDNMMRDFANLSYVGMVMNPLVCNCNTRDFIDIASRNEFTVPGIEISPLARDYRSDSRFTYHSGFSDVNTVIEERPNVPNFCRGRDLCVHRERDMPLDGNYLLLNYSQEGYTCMDTAIEEMTTFRKVMSCRDTDVNRDLDSALSGGRYKLFAILAVPGILLPSLLLVFLFRKNLRYFYLTIRNSAMLSMVNKNKVVAEDINFNYDVFVSYCNEDRPWVLDQLLTHLETDCSVSLCLHERDFQVGMSILENIVSCMDRSKSIMLIISQQFLLSQWCQFELHLAQHRLLETRREDLILVLLEDIPRRLRPNTLHYLMLTKTYIVWPKDKSEEQVFWKRLKKCVIAHNQKREAVRT